MLIEADILVGRVERDKAIAAEFLEKALAANGKDAELADFNGLRAGNEKNIPIFITGHHTIAVNADSKVRISSHTISIDGNFFIIITRKINAGARRSRNIVKADLVDGRRLQRIGHRALLTDAIVFLFDGVMDGIAALFIERVILVLIWATAKALSPFSNREV